ncbi:MAG: DUF2817 domain-containing protein [Planctomycetes bacterium]|nr:DUF2817 domain-containing protein [Planctomycetota bacterium]
MRRLLPILLAVLPPAGCRTDAAAVPPAPPAAFRQDASAPPPAPTLLPVVCEFGRSAAGAPLQARMFGQPASSPAVFFLASIHGDEPAGTPLLERLSDHLSRHPEVVGQRCIVLVPVANPDGLARGTRANRNGVDLNRNFPAPNFRPSRTHGGSPLCEPESQALFSLIRAIDPGRVVSIHMAAARIDFDGPAAELAESMGQASGLPVKRMGARPGSLGSYVGVQLGVPIVTVELRPSDRESPPEALWLRYGDMLLTAVTWPGP